jgi:hypothetical protein
MKYLTAVLAATALLVLVAGCGGGGSSNSTSSTPSDSTNASASGDAASASANEACAEANEEIAAMPQPDSEEAVTEYLDATEKTVERLQVQVAGLNGSAGVTEYSKALSDSVTILNEMANASRSGNPDGVRELSKELEEIHLGKVAEAAGLDTCAEAPGVEA